MPTNESIEEVNMPEFRRRGGKRIDGNTPLKLSAAELKERRQSPGRHVKFYRPEEVPEFNPTTIRKKVCPVCGYGNGNLLAVCYRCRTCFACGSYAGDNKDDNCPVCGNFNTEIPPEKPMIIL